MTILLRPGRGADIAISLSLVSVCQHIYGTAGSIFTNFLCIPVAVAAAQSFSGGVAIRYVLPVSWKTSCLAVMGIYGVAYFNTGA